jgi:hypothetical protein
VDNGVNAPIKIVENKDGCDKNPIINIGSPDHECLIGTCLSSETDVFDSTCEEIGLLSSLALAGWLSFHNFGMLGIIAWTTFRRGQHTKALQFGRPRRRTLFAFT